jgi:predicted DNA-binding transcriptional regulator AlpA
MTHPARPQDRAVDSTNQRPTGDELLTIAEVAAIVRAPVATLRYWRHLGTGPRSFRVGRGVRYWRTDVTAWLEAQSKGPLAG